MTALDALWVWLARHGLPRDKGLPPLKAPYVARHRLEDRQDATLRLPRVVDEPEPAYAEAGSS